LLDGAGGWFYWPIGRVAADFVGFGGPAGGKADNRPTRRNIF
jgi:hypothetical protein